MCNTWNWVDFNKWLNMGFICAQNSFDFVHFLKRETKMNKNVEPKPFRQARPPPPLWRQILSYFFAQNSKIFPIQIKHELFQEVTFLHFSVFPNLINI